MAAVRAFAPLVGAAMAPHATLEGPILFHLNSAGPTEPGDAHTLHRLTCGPPQVGRGGERIRVGGFAEPAVTSGDPSSIGGGRRDGGQPHREQARVGVPIGRAAGLANRWLWRPMVELEYWQHLANPPRIIHLTFSACFSVVQSSRFNLPLWSI